MSHSVICQNSGDMFCVFAESLTETTVQIGLCNSLHLSIHNYIWKYFDTQPSIMYYIDAVVFRPLNAKLLSFMIPSEVFSSRGHSNFILESQKQVAVTSWYRNDKTDHLPVHLSLNDLWQRVNLLIPFWLRHEDKLISWYFLYNTNNLIYLSRASQLPTQPPSNLV